MIFMSDEPQVQQTAEGQVVKIGDFEIFKDHLLGKGAWGEVYQGRQVSLERPVAVNGQVVIRPMMYLALSYDHRIVDGKEAVTFLVRVKENLEDPQRAILDL